MGNYKNLTTKTELKKSLILSMPFIDQFSSKDIESMIKLSQFQTVKKGTILRNVPTGRNEILLIVDGKIKVMLISDDAKEITICVLEKGNILFHFDKLLIFDTTQYILQVDKDTEILNIELTQSVYLENHLTILEFAMSQIKFYFDVLSHSLLQTLSNHLETRVARLLLLEAKTSGENTIQITHAQIASYLNSSREQISMVLGQFADDHLIELGYGKIIILDEDSLRDYVTND